MMDYKSIKGEARRKCMIEDRHEGMTYADMAIKYGISRARCQQIIDGIVHKYEGSSELSAEMFRFVEANIGKTIATRICHAIDRKGITQMQQLEDMTTNDWLKVRNIGKRGAYAISEYIKHKKNEGGTE